MVAGVIGVLLVHLPLDPWSILGPRPGAHRLYLWLSFGVEGSGWILIATGLAGLALRATGAEGRPALLLFRRSLRALAFAGIVVLPVLQTWTMLGYQPTLSEGYGIEVTLYDRFSRLLAAKRLAEGRPAVPVSIPTDQKKRVESMQAMSRQLVGEGLITRDLVITGSVLGEPGLELPSDLYFWTSAGRTSQQPRFGAGRLSRRAPASAARCAHGLRRHLPGVPRPRLS